jgi:hypothetical protein
MDRTDNPATPEILAAVPRPTVEERRRTEILLVRLMLLAIDTVLAGGPLGLETAGDMFREVRHCYRELWTNSYAL